MNSGRPRRARWWIAIGYAVSLALAVFARDSANYGLAPEGMVSGSPQTSSSNYTLDGGLDYYGGTGASANFTTAFGYIGQLVEFDDCPAFTAWQILHFGSAANPDAAPDADSDKDGVTNGEEFFFNMDPTVADRAAVVPGSGSSGLPYVTIADVGGTDRLTLEIVRRKDCGTVLIEASTDLQVWNPAMATLVGVPTSIDADYERVIFSDSVPATAGADRLLRLRVNLP